MSWVRKLFGGKTAQPHVERVVPIATVQLPPTDTPVKLYEDQVLRKAWAEDLLAQQGVRINPHLPCIEGQTEVRVRTAQEIADRLRALVIVAVKGEGLEQERVQEVIEGWGAKDLFTPRELDFVNDLSPSDHDRLQFSWRYEAAWVMYWALNFTGGPLAFPGDVCDVSHLVATVRDTPDLIQKGAQSANNILNEADLIYRYHWAVRQASLDGVVPSGGLNSGVVMERHKALNWLIGYDNADWDEVSTDT